MSVIVRQCVLEWREVPSRLVLVKVKFGRWLWVFVSAYGPGNKRDKTKRKVCFSNY